MELMAAYNIDKIEYMKCQNLKSEFELLVS